MPRELTICRYIDGSPTVMYNIGVGPKRECLLFKRRYPQIKIYGCDPDPTLAEFASAQCDGFIPCAISKTEGVHTLYLEKEGRASLRKVSYHEGKPTTPCVAMTLDEFDRRWGSPSGILLWIDAQGSEIDILQSGHELLCSGRVRWINVEEVYSGEEHEAGWPSPQDTSAVLDRYGYERRMVYLDQRTHRDAIYLPCL